MPGTKLDVYYVLGTGGNAKASTGIYSRLVGSIQQVHWNHLGNNEAFKSSECPRNLDLPWRLFMLKIYLENF